MYYNYKNPWDVCTLLLSIFSLFLLFLSAPLFASRKDRFHACSSLSFRLSSRGRHLFLINNISEETNKVISGGETKARPGAKGDGAWMEIDYLLIVDYCLDERRVTTTCEVQACGPKTRQAAGDDKVVRAEAPPFFTPICRPGLSFSATGLSTNDERPRKKRMVFLFSCFNFYRGQGRVHIDTFISSKHRCKSAAQYILALSLLPCSSFCDSHSSIAHCCVSIIST